MWLSGDEASRRAGVSYTRLMRLASSGQILGRPPKPKPPDVGGRPYRYDGRNGWCFDKASVESWARRHRNPDLVHNAPKGIPSDDYAGSEVVAAHIIGMSEDEAWSVVRACGRIWEDITGADAVTADRRPNRIRVTVGSDERVITASAG